MTDTNLSEAQIEKAAEAAYKIAGGEFGHLLLNSPKEPWRKFLRAIAPYLQAQPEPVDYVSEVRRETPPYKCLSCGTVQAPCCSDCGALLVKRVAQSEPVAAQPDYARLLASHKKLVEALNKMKRLATQHGAWVDMEEIDDVIREAEAITRE